MATAGGEPYDKGAKDDEKKKRPEVEHYKPGAFTGRRTGSEDGRRPRSADCSTRGNEGGGGQGRGATGGGGGGGGKADTLSGGRGRGRFEDQRKSGSANGRKKPEMEPYVPKRVQEQQKVEEIGKSKEDSNSLTETSRSKKKNKKKNKKNEDRRDTSEKKNNEKNTDKSSEKVPSENTNNTGRKHENKENNKKKEKDLRETLENKKSSKISGSQSNPDFKTPSNNSRNDDIHVKRVSQENVRGNKKNGNERIDYYDARKKNNRNSYHDNYDRRDNYKHQSYQNENGYRGSQGRELRRGQSFGYDVDRRDRNERSDRGNRQNFDFRSNSPNNWNWKGGRNKGNGGNSRGNSRVSSPSRSQRGNSPQSSRGNSRRNSPTSNLRTGSPVHHTQVYYRRSATPPRGKRTTASRTPSPPPSSGGAGRGGRRDGRHKRDSRDLEGWSRDNYERSGRRDELWDPRGKPPSGRVKAQMPVKTSLPPRFQKSRDPEDSRDVQPGESMTSSWTCGESEDRRRLDSSGSVRDVSGVSDWSLEVEEEDERRSLADRAVTPLSLPSPSSSRPLSPEQPSARGLIKLPDSSQLSNPHWRPPPDSRHPAWRREEPQIWSASAPSTPSGPPGPQARNPGQSYSVTSVSSSLNQRFPLEPSRFAAPAHLLPHNFQGGPGYRPPFTPRFYSSGGGGPVSISPPDWYDVYNASIYGNRKVDVNCITEIVRADVKLRSILQEGPAIVCKVWDKEVRETRHKIMAAARFLLKNDLLFVAERDVETHIWKTVYYQVIEMLKSAYLDTENTTAENRKTLKSCLINLFDEGVDYYTQLLTDLSTIYRLDLDLFYDPLEPRENGSDRFFKLGIVSAQKCNLCLGDLARYREQVNDGTSSNYGRARQYYTKANHLEMRNGRPFNMLAILAKMNNRKFEAVYYHARCLSSRNAFQSSKEGLVSIFEEMKRRWEVTERKRVEERREGEREREGRRIVRGSKVRKEIWEYAGEDSSGRRLHRTTSANSSADDDLANLSVADLNKRFINTFLYLQGKLYTQIDTDDFPVAASNLLDQFRVLISKSPLPLSTDRLVQIMSLNMFIIEETKMKTSEETNTTYRSVCQDLALSLSGDMFGILLERCNLLVARGSPAMVLQPNSQLEEDLCNLLAPIKVWCDWLLGNNDTWYPLVSSEPFAQLAQLATRLETVKDQVNEILNKCLSVKSFLAQPQARREEFALVKLAEDSLLCEFTPWFRGLSWDSYRLYCPKTQSVPRATAAKRVSQILLAVEFLEGLDNPVLKWSLPDNSHVCLVTESLTSSSRDDVSRDIAVSNLTAMIARDEYILEESYSGEEETEERVEADSEIQRLRERKEELERARRKEQARARKAQREILSEVTSVVLHIRPKVLVPDTNILVDNLSDIKSLAESGDLSVVVPTTVVGELEGLSKETGRSSPGVKGSSRAALTWLREKPGKVRCVTTKGSVLNTFSLATEEDCSDGQKNDDRILQCCLSLNTSPDSSVVQGIKTIHRDSVLITDDRNLRLKAHTADCAVISIKEFMTWIKTVKP